jgi:hypothetical protein
MNGGKSMNNKMIKTLVFFTLSIFLLTITACQHNEGRRHFGHGNGAGLTNHIVKELDLDSEQEIQLTEVLTSFEEKKEELDKRNELRKVFVEQLKNKELDTDYLRQETVELIQELENASNEFITNLGSFHASLNEEQKNKLANIISREKGLKSRHN